MLVMMRGERLESKLMEERRVIWSWRRGQATIEWQQKMWKNSRACKQGEERRGSCASQSNGCCFDSVMEQLFTLETAHARQEIQPLLEEVIRSLEVPATPVHIWQEERTEADSGKRSKRKERPVQSSNGSTSARWAQ